MERGVSTFGGLKSIALLSNAFNQLAYKSAAAAKTTVLGNTRKTVMAFRLASEQKTAKILIKVCLRIFTQSVKLSLVHNPLWHKVLATCADSCGLFAFIAMHMLLQ